MVSLFSCGKDDSKVDYGYSYVYMPQSITQSGGTNNNYTVPSGTDSSTYNYLYDSTTGKIKVILGVYCSGLSATAGYDVTVSASTDTITKMIAAGTLTNTVAMPSSLYSLPSSVSVPAGSRSANFYLSFDRGALLAYSSQKLALAVKISNPTKYTLDSTQATTIVVVNVASLLSEIN